MTAITQEEEKIRVYILVSGGIDDGSEYELQSVSGFDVIYDLHH